MTVVDATTDCVAFDYLDTHDGAATAVAWSVRIETAIDDFGGAWCLFLIMLVV